MPISNTGALLLQSGVLASADTYTGLHQQMPFKNASCSSQVSLPQRYARSFEVRIPALTLPSFDLVIITPRFLFAFKE